MKCIVAQGNPEAKYNGSRHNIGFFIIDELANKNNLKWQRKNKFQSDICELEIAGNRVLLLKPSTYYNQTGQAIGLIKDFYKLDNKDILVVHDELALPFGTIRLRIGGSDAGNKGIKSINQHIGLDYVRIRIGIDNQQRQLTDDSDFVLNKFNNEEKPLLDDILKSALSIIDDFCNDLAIHHTRKITE